MDGLAKYVYVLYVIVKLCYFSALCRYPVINPYSHCSIFILPFSRCSTVMHVSSLWKLFLVKY